MNSLLKKLNKRIWQKSIYLSVFFFLNFPLNVKRERNRIKEYEKRIENYYSMFSFSDFLHKKREIINSLLNFIEIYLNFNIL